MLASFLYGKEDLRLKEVPVPEIGDNEILLKVGAAAICGTDVRMYKNSYKGVSEETPLTLGHELSGTIEKLGKNVTSYSVGQRVAIAPNMGCGICPECAAGRGHMCPDYKALGINMNGGFAEYTVVPERAVRGGNIIPLPDHVSFESAAITEALSCVVNGFEQVKLQAGEYALVVGAGPIGMMHVFMLLMGGAARVYLADLSEERLALAKKLDARIRTISGDAKEYIMKDTNGYGADVIITACPVPAVQKQALEIAANYGRVNFFGGVPADKQPVAIDTNLIHYKQLIVTGSTRASLTQFKKALGFVADGILDVDKLITARLPLKDIQKGFDLASSAQGIKTVITM